MSSDDETAPGECRLRSDTGRGVILAGVAQAGVAQASTLRRKFRSPSVKKIALKARSAG